MKELLIIPFLAALLFFGLVLYAATDNRQVKIHKMMKRELVKAESFELKPTVLVI